MKFIISFAFVTDENKIVCGVCFCRYPFTTKFTSFSILHLTLQSNKMESAVSLAVNNEKFTCVKSNRHSNDFLVVVVCSCVKPRYWQIKRFAVHIALTTHKFIHFRLLCSLLRLTSLSCLFSYSKLASEVLPLRERSLS